VPGVTPLSFLQSTIKNDFDIIKNGFSNVFLRRKKKQGKETGGLKNYFYSF
jgi:hypothetical protein